jgi:hypothetical protein
MVEGSFKGPRQSWEVWGRWFLSMKIHPSFEGPILLLCLSFRGIIHGWEKALKSSKYPTSTLANSTLIILFSKMLKFSKNYFFQIKKYCEE